MHLAALLLSLLGVWPPTSPLEPLRPWPNRLRQELTLIRAELRPEPLVRSDALWRAALALRPDNPAAVPRNCTVTGGREENGWSLLFVAKPARFGAHWLVVVPDRGSVAVEPGL